MPLNSSRTNEKYYQLDNCYHGKLPSEIYLPTCFMAMTLKEYVINDIITKIFNLIGQFIVELKLLSRSLTLVIYGIFIAGCLALC